MEIVGLKQKVDDDINKLICKFVGVKPHPLTIELGTLISRFNFRFRDAGITFSKYMIDEILHCCSCNRLIKGKMLEIHNDLCEECEAELP